MEIHFASRQTSFVREGGSIAEDLLFLPYFHIISILLPLYFFQSTTFEILMPFKYNA